MSIFKPGTLEVPKAESIPEEAKSIGVPKTPDEYAAKYELAKIRSDQTVTIGKRANLLIKYRSRYEKVANHLGIPWFVVACIHNQESGSDVGVFKACLHNGEKIIGTGKKTTLHPAGRGPFWVWEDAAIDALRSKVADIKAWTLGTCLEFFERYNGLGYRNRGVVSPYLWAMTDQYEKGHFVADGKFDPNAVSKNFGIVAIMKRFEELNIELFAKVEPQPEAGKITRKMIAEKIVSIIVKDCEEKLRETQGKNRSPRIDEFNKRAGAPLGSPYCASGAWCAIDDACKELGLKNPVPKTASSQAFRRTTFVPSKYMRPVGVLGKLGDVGVLQNKEDTSHGHLVTLRDDQIAQPMFKTAEYNTDAIVGDRDGDGAYLCTRSTENFVRENAGKRFICFTDVAQWIADANGL